MNSRGITEYPSPIERETKQSMLFKNSSYSTSSSSSIEIRMLFPDFLTKSNNFSFSKYFLFTIDVSVAYCFRLV